MIQPRAFYNEIDPAAATWLENLIADGLIADGDVCRTSIVDLKPNDLAGYTQVHLFAGIGGWSLALRMAGWPDSRPVWTGSCPCQPFSLAGKREGFNDSRHLWPYFRNLIGQCRPPVVFGEQVASATQWLGLVRSDLEAMEYAVGCMPIEAASAGADHLRDRYWFVGERDWQRGAGSLEYSQSERWCQGRAEYVVRSGRDAAACDGGSIDVANTERNGRQQGTEILCRRQPVATACGETFDPTWTQGRLALRERADQRPIGNASGPSVLSDSKCAGSFSSSHGGIHCGQESLGSRHVDVERHGAPFDSDFSWVIGADGKARRVKSGIRLLAHGIPGRVAKLRGFGNAIDPRPSAAFIGAYLDVSGAFA